MKNLKRCSTCKKEKSKVEFSKNSRTKDGLRSYCRECAADYRAEYKKKNLQKIRDQLKGYRKTHREKIRECKRNYHENHIEEERIKAKQRRMRQYLVNPEKE
jgi:hypothetical protein